MLTKFLNKSLKFQIIFTIIIVISVPVVVTAWNILVPSNVSNTIKSMHQERLVNLLNYFDETITKEEIYNLRNNPESFPSIEKRFKAKLEPNMRFINGTKLGIYIVLGGKDYILNNQRNDKEISGFKSDFPFEEIKQDLEKNISNTLQIKQDGIYYTSYGKLEMLRCLRPVTLNGEIIAVVWDEVVLPPNVNIVRRTITYTLAFVIFSLTVGFFLMITILKNLNKNVIKIRNGLETMPENLSYRIENMGGDLGKVAESINKMTEVLEQKEKLEEQLVRADKLASLGQMISGVAHEIRNPLSIIRGTVQLMERDFKEVSGLKEYVRVIKEQSDRENRVIQELLDYARPSRQILLDMNINVLINSVLAFTDKYIQDKHVKLELNLDDNLPTITIDGDKIKQVFVNVIINACESMENGGTLSIRTTKENRWIKTYFEDTGVGMDELQVKSIFNPYYSTKPKGTGLGLSISSSIIQMHNGIIEVSSKRGEGSIFVVKLPYRKEDGETSG
jgi:two-component system, NtrC family, sensor histidine kinase HydH